MSQQPYYFELVVRNMVTRRNDKDHGNFRFYMHKNSQRVDFSKTPIKGIFSERRLKIENSRLNFFLPNYFPGKSYNSKFILSLTQQTYSNQKPVGSYTIDPNIYIEQYKRNSRNHFAEIWDLSEDYSVEVEIFFDESKYSLEKLLREYSDSVATSFSKPMVSKALEEAKKAEIQEDREYDDEERYNSQRMKLFNKYAGALVGHGGYRIFDDEAEKIVKKQSELKKSNNRYETNRYEPISTPSKSKQQEDPKQSQNSKNQTNKEQQKTPFKEKAIQEENPEAQMKSIKFLIIGIVILILLGSGYFLSKIFFKDDAQSIEVPKISKQSKETSGASKKSKAKESKKSKNSKQL